MTAAGARLGALRHRALLAVLAAVLLAGATGICGCIHAGRFLAREDPLQRADAIFVFAGSQTERPLEGVDLFHARLAPVIVLTRDRGEREVALARNRGVSIPSRFEIARDLLGQLGVPSEALLLPERLHDSTADEAATLRELALAHGWRRVIVVSSTYHLRRVAFACRRALRGTGVEILARGSRYDDAEPSRWWRRRSDIRWVTSESVKLAAYALGIQP